MRYGLVQFYLVMSTNRPIDACLLKVSSSYADSDLPSEFSQNGHSQWDVPRSVPWH